MSTNSTHEEYCAGSQPEFVINFTLDVSIDGDGGKMHPPIVIPRVFTNLHKAERVARQLQRQGGGILQGIGLMHNHPECEGILCLNKLDEMGDDWEEDHLCYYQDVKYPSDT